MKRISTYRSLDIFRGFAALWVVMCHSCVPWLANQHQAFYSNPVYAFAVKGQLGVVLFFVISGYCITAAVHSAVHSGKSLRRYFFERLRRIYPPYLFALLLTVGTNLALRFAEVHHLIGQVHHQIDVDSSFRYWAGNLLLLQYELHTPFVSNVFWSLCYEVAFYVLMGIFLLCAQQVRKKQGPPAATLCVVFALGASTVASLGYLLVTGKTLFPFDQWHLFSLGGLLFFLLEMKPSTMSGYTESGKRFISGTTGFVGLLLCLYAALRQVGVVDVSHPSSRIRSIAAVVFCLALGWLRKYDERILNIGALKPLLYLGTFSYSLYLIHPIVLPFVDPVLRKAGLDGSLYFVAFALQIGAAILAGRWMFVGVEKFFLSKKQDRRLESELVTADASMLGRQERSLSAQ